jgi:hypothetical protein
MIVDPLMPAKGSKGYVCCDIILSRKGEDVVTQSYEIDEDIEA